MRSLKDFLKPESEGAAQSFEGVAAEGVAVVTVADGVLAVRGKPEDHPVGHTGSVNEIGEAKSEAHARNRSSPVAQRPPENTDVRPPAIFSGNDL